MKKRAYVALSLLAPIAVLAGCGQSDLEKQVQPQQQEGQETQKEPKETAPQKEGKEGTPTKTQEDLIKEKIDEQNQAIDELTDEVEYYRTFIKDFTSAFSTEEMNEFIEKEWNYKLMISNINFPKNGVLELSDTSFDLVLTEDKVPYSVIPDEMSLKGKIQGELKGQISFAGEAKPETKDDVTEKNSVYTYSFKDVPSDSVIKFTISEALQKELGMDKKELEIRIQ
jgi:type I restriction-modification system DNA methylase subunit